MNLTTLTIMKRLLNELRAIDKDITVSTCVAFTEIAARDSHPDAHPSVQDIGQLLDLPSSTSSRTVSLLTDWTYKRVEGPALVEAYEDRMNRTTKRLRLTDKGRALVKRLQGTIDGY